MSKAVGVFVFLLAGGCIEPIDLSSINYEKKLVVEGLITNETKQHQIILSRTNSLNNLRFTPEERAFVSIIDSNGVTTPTTEASPGIYKTPYFSGTIGLRYKLSIVTSNGDEFVSEEVTLMDTPPIEKIYAQYSTHSNAGPGIQIFLDTSDPQNNTHYYRWEYEGTYEIKTPYPSKFIWTGGNTLTIRTNSVDHCWASDTSKNVLIRTTQGLLQNKVVAFPLKFIPAESPDLVIKYSILAKQYSLNEKSFFFWKQLEEINEEQGSLFDKQPGTIAGNIFSVNNNQKSVLGYFDASAVATMRAFFTPRQFAESGYIPPLYLQSCVETAPVTIPIEELGETMEAYQKSLIIADAGGEGPSVVFLMRIACCDCTSRGTNLKPTFWE
ncbi:MAG: DUF4249 domain-containing protein [Chryseolinea sp.]